MGRVDVGLVIPATDLLEEIRSVHCMELQLLEVKDDAMRLEISNSFVVGIFVRGGEVKSLLEGRWFGDFSCTQSS